MRKQFEYHLVDVFTSKQFGGNPLAVFPNAQEIPGHFMQKIANELNLSETTFILPPKSKDNDCKVMIFTPAVELPMAGHPTIGTAFVILENELFKPKNDKFLMFEEGVGPIKVYFKHHGDDSWEITMVQPLPLFTEIYENRDKIAQLLSLETSALDHDLPIQIISCGVPFVYIPIKSMDDIKSAKVRLDLLDEYLGNYQSQALFLFTRETVNPSSTVHSRMFAPNLGVLEDPATGSASGPLGAYLVKYGLSEGKNIISEQGFEIGRPSIIKIDIDVDNDNISAVKVGGESVTVGKGKMFLNINEG